MNEQTLRKRLTFYQKMMMVAKTAGDMAAHEVYKQITRQLSEELQQKEKTARGERTA
ncbi:hypothetical protein ABEO98_22575 [Brevibacillus parabrevis]|uniref:hypothetical protein n=1 Tax=Brevibacillus parabrevis TaxID=54914 RepID=UPI002491E281|nr:hypothetical protein [Brevibacillus parabrevis]